MYNSGSLTSQATSPTNSLKDVGPGLRRVRLFGVCPVGLPPQGYPFSWAETTSQGGESPTLRRGILFRESCPSDLFSGEIVLFIEVQASQILFLGSRTPSDRRAPLRDAGLATGSPPPRPGWTQGLEEQGYVAVLLVLQRVLQVVLPLLLLRPVPPAVGAPGARQGRLVPDPPQPVARRQRDVPGTRAGPAPR